MFLERNPWIVPVAAVLTAVVAYFLVVLTHGIDQSDLLGSWFFFATIFVSFAAIALVAYRSLRRSRAPAAMDEAERAPGAADHDDRARTAVQRP